MIIGEVIEDLDLGFQIREDIYGLNLYFNLARVAELGTPCFSFFPSVFRSVRHPRLAHLISSSPMSFLFVDARQPCSGRSKYSHYK